MGEPTAPRNLVLTEGALPDNRPTFVSRSCERPREYYLAITTAANELMDEPGAASCLDGMRRVSLPGAPSPKREPPPGTVGGAGDPHSPYHAYRAAEVTNLVLANMACLAICLAWILAAALCVRWPRSFWVTTSG